MSSEPDSDLESERPGSMTREHNEIDHDVDESSSDESDESSESDEGENHGFLDVEAVESGDESDEDGMDDELEAGFEFESFPQFTRLPPELRQRIWEFFDPDMRAPARVFGFRMPFSGANELHEGPLLERQTAPARAVLATHQESREYALKYYPDAVEKGGEPGMIRYRKETDIIMVSGYFRDFASISSWQDSNVFTGIHNIALDLEGTAEHQYEDLLSTERPHWPNLQSTYFVTQAITHHTRSLRWCGSDAVQTYHLQVEELDTGLGEDYEAIYCWPQGKEREHNSYPAFGHEEEMEEMAETEEAEETHNSSLGQTCSVIKIGEETIWPIVVFDFEGSGVHRYDKLRELYPADGDWEKAGDWHSDEFSGDEEDELSPDEYESEGIDDGSIDEGEASGDEDDLHVIDDESEQDYDTSVFNGFSPPPDDFTAVVESANFSSVEADSARFSSIEPESPGHSDAGASGTEEECVRGARRPRGRVLEDSEDDSGDENDDGEEPVVQIPSRRKRVVVSESDDDEDMINEEEEVKTNRRRKRVMSDSEEEDEEQDASDEGEQTRSNKRRKRIVESDSEDEGEASRSNKRRRRTVMPESDDEEEEVDDDDSATEQGEDESDDDSEEDEKPQRKPSLAERLQLFRSEVPVAPSPEPGSEPDSDMEQLRNGDYDDPYADAYDRDDDGEGEALSENDQLLDMDGDEEDPYGGDGSH